MSERLRDDARPGTSLTLSVAALPGEVYTVRHIPLNLTFHNSGDEPIRLLHHFEPIPVFFEFHMVDAGGRSMAIPGAGKIDFFHDSMRYTELPAGGSLTTDVDLSVVLARPDEVEPGRFLVSVTYHNQYGDQCFRGKVSSDPIAVTIDALT